jgi:hypothetical protein
MSKDVMKLALEALENWVECFPQNVDDIDKKAITSLREALNASLAKPDFWEGYEPEPVKQAQCKYPKCSYPCTDLPDCRDAEQPAQQDPVAYLCENAVGHKYFRWKKPSSEFKPIALYTTPPAPVQEPVTWRNAAIRVGEDLCSVGPFGYYDMTAEQWLDWALSVVTVHAPPAATLLE